MRQALQRFEAVCDAPLAYARALKAESGRRIIGVLPMQFPLELAHAAGALPVILQEDREPITVGQSQVFTFYCGYNRSLTDQLMRGEFDCLDAVLFGDHCVQLLATADVIRAHLPNTPILFNQLISSLAAPWAMEETRNTFRQLWSELEELIGRPIAAADAARSIRLYNRDRQLMRAAFDLRREGRLNLTGRQMQLIVKSGMIMDVEAHIALLEEIVGAAAPTPAPETGVRVYLSGHYCQAPKPEILDVIEECGGHIVDDDLYHGFRFISTDMDETLEPVEALARWYLERNLRAPCATLSDERADWDDFLLDAVGKARAQGLIILQVKYCEPHMYYYPEIKEAFDQRAIPHLLIETEHEQMPLEALKTRVETFLEIARRRAA
ncbi:MAG: 2-hydroxyacyl-CoA dehydratase [Methylobacteriaceae bacterium]|nr:2-hydroxyacyl-CoA dehydratase [Methylobacteriaceae bacterium]